MPGHRITRTLAAVLAAGVLTSCGGDVLQSARDHDRVTVKRERAAARAAQADTASEPRAGAEERKPPSADPEPARAAARRVGEGNAADEERAAGTGTRDRPASTTAPDDTSRPTVSCAGDLAGDEEGSRSAPAYTDLRRGCLREQGSDVVLEATTAGALPARMPDRGTNLTMGYEIGRDVFVGIGCSSNGWYAYLTRGSTRRDLPAPEVAGTQVRLATPASVLGPGPVPWRLESGWTRSTLTTTSYAFDEAPNGATATFRRG